MPKRLTLSSSDVKIAGVCGGIAEYLNVDSTLIRILFIVFACCGGWGVLAYLICWAVMPRF
ncbi:MAG TPA: PspC family transcriptional regulator [Rikenellaceae bacterium]|nr:PspC family transcriptional regulator [Rikenellaceae bacterium]